MIENYNLEAEQAILGVLLTDNEKLFRCPNLKQDYFYHCTHVEIFGVLKEMILDGKEANQVTMSGKVKIPSDLGGNKYLAQIAGLSTAILNLDTYVEIVADLYQRRKLVESLEARLAEVNSTDEVIPTEDIVNQLHIDCLDIGADTGQIQVVSRREVTQKVIDAQQEDLACYSTGIKTIDDLTGGGFYAKKNYCYAAPPKCGKTTLLQTMWDNMSNAGIPVAYICAEMGQEEIHQRNIARAIAMPSSNFLVEKTRKEKIFIDKLIQYQGEEIKNGWFVDAPGITFHELQRTVLTLIRRHGVKGIYLDYFQLVQGHDQRAETLVRFHERLAEWIAVISRKEQIFFCYAAQLNKKDKSMRGGQAIEMNVDQLTNLFFDSKECGAWLKMEATRYLGLKDAGSKAFPALTMEKNGPYFVDSKVETAIQDNML